MGNQKPDKVTRLEIVTDKGREVIFDRDGKQVELDYQDDGRTLKVFVTEVRAIMEGKNE